MQDNFVELEPTHAPHAVSAADAAPAPDPR
jgi:hypothetical protein